MQIIKNYLTKNRCYQYNVKRKPSGIQLHTIGCAQGTAQSVADYWNSPDISACVTYIVDCDTPGKVLQCLPEDVRSWADKGYGNDHLITFEICESDYMEYKGGASYTVSNTAKFQADLLRGYNTAVDLCADICKRYGWDPTDKLSNGLHVVSSHDEGRRLGLSSAHVDPTHVWPKIGKTMDDFRRDVKTAMGGAGKNNTKTGGKCKVTVKRLTKGSKGNQVRTVQRLLNALGYKGKDGKKLTVDGEFGDNVEYALIKFQKDKGFQPTVRYGICAAGTWKLLLNAK